MVEHGFGYLVLKIGLNRAFYRSCAILFGVGLIEHGSFDFVRYLQGVTLCFESLAQFVEFVVKDDLHRFARERVESDDVIDTIDELRRESLVERFEQGLLLRFVVRICCGKSDSATEVFELACADIGGKDDYRVFDNELLEYLIFNKEEI